MARGGDIGSAIGEVIGRIFVKPIFEVSVEAYGWIAVLLVLGVVALIIKAIWDVFNWRESETTKSDDKDDWG